MHESVGDEQMMWLCKSAFIRKAGQNTSSENIFVADMLPGSFLTLSASV